MLNKFFLFLFIFSLSGINAFAEYDSKACSKYAQFKLHVESGKAQLALVELRNVCPNGPGQAQCPGLHSCFPRAFASVASIHVPQSFKVLEEAQFDMAELWSPSNNKKKVTDAVDDLVRSCDAEGLLLLRAAGARKLINEKRQSKIIKTLKAHYDQINSQYPSVTKARRANQCQISQWIIGLSDEDIRGLADSTNLDESHNLLSSWGFDDACGQVFSPPNMERVLRRLISYQNNVESLEQDREKMHCSQKEHITFDSLNPISQIDRILIAIKRLQTDETGIFSPYYPPHSSPTRPTNVSLERVSVGR